MIDGLASATSYPLSLTRWSATLAEATTTTLPAAAIDEVTLVMGSCFDIDSSAAGRLAESYGAVTPTGRDGERAVFNIWCGDQVYVDAPFNKTWNETGPSQPVLDKYVRTWGLGDERSGLADAMATTSNWFLPDDHEFWNGYPHPSFATLPAHTAVRMLNQLRRFRTSQSSRPHPYAQGAWGRIAGEAYCAFQSDKPAAPFSQDVSPSQLQVMDLGNAVVVLADTRWHRTIRKSGRDAGFMHQADLDALCRLLTSERRLVCLSLSRPLIGRLPHRGAFRGKAEYAHEDYARQYTQLWRTLSERAVEERLPTLVFGGDVHHHSVRTAFGNRIVEVVSSPLAHLASLERGSRFAKVADVWAELKRTSHRLAQILRNTERRDPSTAMYPSVTGPGVKDWEAVEGESHFEAGGHKSGIAAITIRERG